MQVSDGVALRFSGLVNRLRETFSRYGCWLDVNLDWWLRRAVLVYSEKDYVQLVADNGMYLVIDLRPSLDGRAPYYVVGHLGGGRCAED